VHVSRTLQTLRAQGLIELKISVLTILDWPGLQEAGQFTSSYLHLKPQHASLSGDGHAAAAAG
jgi:hypothetical protein